MISALFNILLVQRNVLATLKQGKTLDRIGLVSSRYHRALENNVDHTNY